MTTALSIELTKYATLTANDMGEDFAAAARAMRDEPTEVAAEVGCSVDDVLAWCAEVQSYAGAVAVIEEERATSAAALDAKAVTS